MRKKRKKIYSIARLLNKQPLALKKRSDYKNLVMQYSYSNSLKKLRFRRVFYSLLNKAKIKPKYLSFILSKYNIPHHSFFPQFLRMKLNYIQGIEKRRKEKEQFIIEKLKKLPNTVKRIQKKLYEIEKSCNKKNKFPIWTKTFYPKTKKYLFELQKKNKIEWVILFFDFLDILQKEYGNNKYIQEGYTDVSLFLLGLNSNDKINLIKINFRRLSLKFHPDLGGSSQHFNILQRAKEILIKK